MVCVSPLQINVDHHIHEKINRYMKAPGLCCFDEAVRHVYKLMESDSYSRFLRSDAYLGLRRKARTFWSTLGVKSLWIKIHQVQTRRIPNESWKHETIDPKDRTGRSPQEVTHNDHRKLLGEEEMRIEYGEALRVRDEWCVVMSSVKVLNSTFIQTSRLTDASKVALA